MPYCRSLLGSVLKKSREFSLTQRPLPWGEGKVGNLFIIFYKNYENWAKEKRDTMAFKFNISFLKVFKVFFTSESTQKAPNQK